MEDTDQDDRPSERQEEWQTLAMRLRLQLERSLQVVEKQVSKSEDDGASAQFLEQLSGAACHIFFLERQAATMDIAIRRDAGGY